MGYIQGADRNQIVLFPEALDDYVEEDNEVRVMDAFIDGLDIAEMGFKAEAAREGRPGYDPRDMLKLYMYGYTNHIRSSRRLQREAARNVEVMWLLKKIVPDFRCIADFRKDNAKAIKEVFRAFVRVCNGAGLLSHESVVIDGSKFRAVNADNKSYISGNTVKVLKDIEGKIDQYMREMDARDKEEAKPGELWKEELKKVLDYLERRKEQLTNALKKIEESGGNQICTTDPECRVMKTRDGIRPSYNVQTAVEVDNHIIVHYDVTDECVDWNLLKAGIDASKEALGVKNIEGIADRGYSNSEEVLDQWDAGEDAEEAAAAVRELVNAATSIMNEEVRGLIPGTYFEQVKVLNTPPKLSGQSILKKYVGTITSEKRKTRTKLNRRQPTRFDLSGEQDEKTLKIVVAIDTSASVTAQDVAKILREVVGILAKRKHVLTVIECDSEVQRVYRVKGESDIKKNVSGRGGTAFTPVIEYVNNGRYFRDALLIYFTDGYGEREIPRPNTYRNLWVVLGDEENLSLKEPYGTVISF